MPTNPLDRKLVHVFKALGKSAGGGGKTAKTGQEYREIRSRVVDAGVALLLDHLFAELSRPASERTNPTVEQAVKSIMDLRDRTFVETSGFWFDQWKALLAGLPFEAALPAVPDAASLEIWRKESKLPAPELASRLTADAVGAYATPGADWLLFHVKPASIMPVLGLYLNRQERPKFLPAWMDALEPALKKDKPGVLLESILCHPWPDKRPVATLSEVLRLNRPLFKSTVEILPAILCKKTAPELGVYLVEGLFNGIYHQSGAELEFQTAALARLGTGILLQDRRGPVAEAVLAFIGRVARQLRTSSGDDMEKARIWILENLKPASEPGIAKNALTVEGARYYALAFEKAERGFAATDILAATARNLGLSEIGKKGEAITYNPLQHEDLEGGMLPGDAAIIEASGWALGQDVVRRVKVKKGASHV